MCNYLVKNHIMGKSTLSDNQTKVGDVNGNGQIDASDYVLIKKIVLKKKIMNVLNVKIKNVEKLFPSMVNILKEIK